MTATDMSWIQTLSLGLVQGLTEFLPISSSGHLRIVSEVLWGADAGASFTAVTQLGTEAAVLAYFAKDIARIVRAWFAGLRNPAARDLDYRMGWWVIIGTIPVGLGGFLLADQIRTGARNLWLIATTLIVFGLVMGAAEYFSSRRPERARPLEKFRTRDGILMGLAQALSLVPGVSRSGSTLSAGLFLGLSRPAAARYSFLLAIPAVVASGLFSLPDAFAPAGDGLAASGSQLLVATLLAFAVALASIRWLMNFVSHHTLYAFVIYRVALGAGVLALLATGTISAT